MLPPRSGRDGKRPPRAISLRGLLPCAIRDLAGAPGEALLDELVGWDPVARISAQAALEHGYFTTHRLHWPLGAPPSSGAFAGSRHPWMVLIGQMDVALLRRLHGDFVDISGLHLDTAAGRQDR